MVTEEPVPAAGSQVSDSGVGLWTSYGSYYHSGPCLHPSFTGKCCPAMGKLQVWSPGEKQTVDCRGFKCIIKIHRLECTMPF